jgi:hypothetical protein
MFMTHVSAWRTSAAVVLSLFQLAQTGHAQPAPGERAPISPQIVEQKISMVDKVLNQ